MDNRNKKIEQLKKELAVLVPRFTRGMWNKLCTAMFRGPKTEDDISRCRVVLEKSDTGWVSCNAAKLGYLSRTNELVLLVWK